MSFASLKHPRFIGFLALILLMISSIAYWQWPTLCSMALKYFVINYCEKQGIYDVTIQQAYLSSGEINIQGLAIPLPDEEDSQRSVLYAEQVIVPFNVNTLFNKEISSIEIEGMTLISSLSRWQKFFRDPGNNLSIFPSSSSTSLPEITVNKARVHLETPGGEVIVPFTLKVESKDKGWVLDSSWTTPQFPEAAGQITVEATPTLFHLKSTLQNFNVSHGPFHLAVPLLSFELISPDHQHYTLSLAAQLQELKIESQGALKIPLLLSSQASGTLSALHIEATVTPLPSSSPNPTLAKLAGDFQGVAATGQINIEGHIPSIHHFWKPPQQPQENTIRLLNGSVQTTGYLSWSGEWLNPDGRIQLQLKDISAESKNSYCAGLNGSLSITRLNPLQTQDHQILHATDLKFSPLRMKNSFLDFAIYPGGTLMIHHFKAQLMGGTIDLHSFSPLGESLEKGFQFETNFHAVQLGELIKLTNTARLSGSALLNGTASFTLTNYGLTLKRAHIYSISDIGTLQYTPFTAGNSNPSPPSPSEESGVNGAAFAFEALKNLKFTLFNLDITAPPEVANQLESSNMQAKLKIIGFNPEVLYGNPFEFNIVTSGQLGELINDTLKSLHTPEGLAGLNKSSNSYRGWNRK